MGVSSGVVPTKKLRLDETSSDLDRNALLGGYAISVVQHYSTLAAGQGTPLEWTATFGHDSENTRYGTDIHLVHGTEVVEGTGHETALLGGYAMPAVEHYSALDAGQGRTPSLEWTATFGHDNEDTRYGTDAHLVHGTEVVEVTGHGTDLQTALLGGHAMPAVEHYSILVAGQGILWNGLLLLNMIVKGTRYETDTDLVHGIDDVEETGHGTDLVGETDLVG
ncbi:hypothetical protein KY284_027228 [Solanum tuberosum]|nr:hypothetical protein KY284_027228 [Solanum tuberosum]